MLQVKGPRPMHSKEERLYSTSSAMTKRISLQQKNWCLLQQNRPIKNLSESLISHKIEYGEIDALTEC